VLKYELTSLADLLTSTAFPHDGAIADKQASLRLALADYCEYVAKNLTELSSCDPPVDPAPVVPPERFFGGMFQVDDCGTNNVKNPMTGDLNCPTGFEIVTAARLTAPEGSACGALQSFCVLPASERSPQPTFGGTFQLDDDGRQAYPNYITGSNNCPGGFNALRMERTLQPESNVGSWLYICLAPFVPGKSQLGGFYQLSDLGCTDNVVNPFTGGPSCPQAYGAMQYGRILVPEQPQNGANAFVCVLQDNVHLPDTH